MKDPGEKNQTQDDRPEPIDDGSASHLAGKVIPSMALPTTGGDLVNLAEIPGWVVVYCYPMTGRPDRNVIPEGWYRIPGAKGCTPQSCAFRDHHAELQSYDARVFGLSTQSSAYQREARERLHLPFELLSDTELTFARALELPTFTAQNKTYLKRTTLVLLDGQVKKVFYPVFPPERNAADVVAWLAHQTE